MKKYRNIIKLSNLLLDALCELKRARLQKIQASLEDFSHKCSDATKDAHLFYAAVEKGWFGSAEKIGTRVNRNLSDFSYQLQRFNQFLSRTMEDKGYLLEQYKILMGLYDTEVTRFWTRFNLFLGFQIALAAGVFSGSKFFSENTPIFRLTMIAILIISFFSAVIHLRGHIRQRHLIKTISVLESNSKGILILLTTYRSITNESPSGNSFIASIVGGCMTMFWFILFIYLEVCGYAV